MRLNWSTLPERRHSQLGQWTSAQAGHFCGATKRSAVLRWNLGKEMFVGDDEANRHPSVTRPRREGYELPKIT
jgi:hypothetical protein